MTPVDLAKLAAAGTGPVWVGLDFDGTLSPHVDDPAAAAILPAARVALDALASHPRAAVAVISGRAIDEVVKRVPVPRVAFAGNHGLEFRDGDWTETDPHAAAAAAEIAHCARDLLPELVWIPGAFAEVKRFTVSVDARRVDEPRRHEVFTLAAGIAQKYSRLELKVAAFGADVRPRGAGHKGTAAVKLRDRQAGPTATAVFIGDDRTDEDAFETLRGDVTIKVGPGPTAAAYRVADPHAVAAFLAALAVHL